MLGVDTKVPHLHWPYGPVVFEWSFVHDLIIYKCAQGEGMRMSCAIKIFFSGKLTIDCLYTTVSDGELHCVFACGGKKYYVHFSRYSLEENRPEEVSFLCWSPTLSFVLFGMLFNIFVCLKKHLLFQDNSSHHVHVKVVGFYLGKFNTPVLKKMQR